mmetsp:Transcript_37705/g.62528  ORF Transcript_37705/g.62528 Transcript_37705/m.62528 type:complete len:119 (-) Transcript_37705:112-468(-)
MKESFPSTRGRVLVVVKHLLHWIRKRAPLRCTLIRKPTPFRSAWCFPERLPLYMFCRTESKTGAEANYSDEKKPTGDDATIHFETSFRISAFRRQNRIVKRLVKHSALYTSSSPLPPF